MSGSVAPLLTVAFISLVLLSYAPRAGDALLSDSESRSRDATELHTGVEDAKTTPPPTPTPPARGDADAKAGWGRYALYGAAGGALALVAPLALPLLGTRVLD